VQSFLGAGTLGVTRATGPGAATLTAAGITRTRRRDNTRGTLLHHQSRVWGTLDSCVDGHEL